MIYTNSQMKIDSLVSYLNEEKINLSPAFQRGHVWAVGARKKLLKNIVLKKPIPAIFLYKEASGSRYSYNILDGKQRLESLILFIGSKRNDLKIKNWHSYFFYQRYKKDAHFPVELQGEELAFHQLGDDVVRDFREYAIPTIEISLDDDSTLDEVISLFVDINQQGVPVNRFDIVKAMCKDDPLLASVFDLIAQKQQRRQDIFYKMKSTDFSRVLKRLSVIDNATAESSKVDRMWERLLEVALFVKSRKHRKPVEVLKGFISGRQNPNPRLTKDEVRELRAVFGFLRRAYTATSLGASRLATDQTHFYTMATSIVSRRLLERFTEESLRVRLERLGGILDGTRSLPSEQSVRSAIKDYQEVSAKQTTDTSRRVLREQRFSEIVGEL